MSALRQMHAVDPTDVRFPLCNTFGAYRRSDRREDVTCGRCLRILNPVVRVEFVEAGGIAWCDLHQGVVNEDSPDGRCDMHDRNDRDELCTAHDLYWQREVSL